MIFIIRSQGGKSEAHCSYDSLLDAKLAEFLRLSPIYGKNIVLDALHISKGTYHNRIVCGHTPTFLEKRREQISREVQRIFDESRQCYGADKILSILQDKGYHTYKVRPHRFNNYKSPGRKEQDYYSRIRN